MPKPGRHKQKKRPSKDATWEAKLRESEQRFRSLTNLSSDWYWEQDADYRFTRVEGRYVTVDNDPQQHRLIGKRRWETNLSIDGGWPSHREMLEARRPYHDV